MASAPLSIKLRCASWQQLASIYRRDLARNAIFLKSQNPPPIGTPVRIDLTLPSESMVVLTGAIATHVGEGELDGRGPGVDVRLNTIPQSAMWLIETALASAAQKEEASKARPAPARAGHPRAASHGGARDDAGLGDGSDLAAAETELIVALTSELGSLKRLNPFQVLGLGYEATDEAVRAAFGDLTKRYHPDRYARFQSPELRNLAAEIFILIRDAYRRLHDAAARAQVLAQLGGRAPARAATPAPLPPPPPAGAPRAATPPAGTPRPATPPAGTPRAATPPAGTPRVSTVGALPATPRPAPVPRAATPAPVAPPPPVDAGKAPDISMAESMLDAGKYDEALAYFRLLAKKNPNDRTSRAGIELAEGLRALAARDRLEAAQRFEAVLELDPANERAARELAEMRRLATNERKGMLSRLLGKKE